MSARPTRSATSSTTAAASAAGGGADCALSQPSVTRPRVPKLPTMARLEETGTLSRDDLRECLREMLLIRRFEEKVEERFRAGELPGFLHVAIGQEAVAVGVCQAMEDGDVFASTHRAHGHTLARGTPPNALMAELYGKVEGCSRGYGGSRHPYDPGPG